MYDRRKKIIPIENLGIMIEERRLLAPIKSKPMRPGASYFALVSCD
jgi:hypothetical protein